MVSPSALSHPDHPRHLLARVDLVLLVATLAVAFLGVIMVYSATSKALSAAGDNPHYYAERQALFFLLGVVVMVVVALIDYRKWEQVATVLYVGVILALVAVISPLGHSQQGSSRWFNLGFFQLQPSEFATLALIVVVATYCNRRVDGLTRRDLVRLLVMAGVPILLVFKQPDLGTAIVMSMVLLVMLSTAGTPLRYLVVLLLGAVVFTILAVKVGLVHQYQIGRITSFLNPNAAGAQAQQAVYNVTQAKTAIGSGGFWGSGLFRGGQTVLAYVPEEKTDFIFSAVGEQLGFVGSTMLILLYAVIAWRIVRIAQGARDTLGQLLAAGSFAFIAFSVIENAGMNMGIMPVAGIPLPLMSYGGSAAACFFSAVGLALSVKFRSSRLTVGSMR